MKSLRAANSLLRSCTAACGVVPRPAFSSTRAAASQCQVLLTGTPRHSRREADTPLRRDTNRRCFSQTALRSKKKQKPAAAAVPDDVDDTPQTQSKSDPNNPQPNPEEPYDLSDLTHVFAKIEKGRMELLGQVVRGPRFNADMIGNVRVELDRKTAEAYPLRELATVAPVGGRRWAILAFDEASVKPIMSAIQKSDDFNQQPQRSDDNPLELTVTIEPERPEELARRAKAICQTWREKVRAETRKRETVHKKWRQDKAITADDLTSLKDKVQKLQDEVMKVVAQKEKEALQNIQRAS